MRIALPLSWTLYVVSRAQLLGNVVDMSFCKKLKEKHGEDWCRHLDMGQRLTCNECHKNDVCDNSLLWQVMVSLPESCFEHLGELLGVEDPYGVKVGMRPTLEQCECVAKIGALKIDGLDQKKCGVTPLTTLWEDAQACTILYNMECQYVLDKKSCKSNPECQWNVEQSFCVSVVDANDWNQFLAFMDKLQNGGGNEPGNGRVQDPENAAPKEQRGAFGNMKDRKLSRREKKKRGREVQRERKRKNRTLEGR